jgi:hypothetical protein
LYDSIERTELDNGRRELLPIDIGLRLLGIRCGLVTSAFLELYEDILYDGSFDQRRYDKITNGSTTCLRRAATW